MLLVSPRLRRVFPLRRWCSRRPLSSAVPKYSSKVRALPFSISPKYAIATMNLFANTAFISQVKSFTLVGFQDLWKLLDDSPIVPLKQVQAVYLPGWIVDAEVQTNAWLGESAQQLTTVQLVDSYLPGCSFDALSRISFNNNNIASNAVPFSNDLITQHGSQILCLPYSISPLSLVKKLRSQPKRIVVNDDLQFDPAINLNFLAAYPILIPLYLAQYENESMSTTVVLDASANRAYFELSDDSWMRSSWALALANHVHVHSNYWQSQGPTTPFSKVTMPSSKHSNVLHQWLDEMISLSGSAKKLISGSPVDFADSRVREFTKEETDKNRDFLNASSDMENMKHMLKNLTDEDPRLTALGVKIGIPKIDDTAASIIESEIDKLRQKRDAMMPQWWEKASKS